MTTKLRSVNLPHAKMKILPRFRLYHTLLNLVLAWPNPAFDFHGLPKLFQALDSFLFKAYLCNLYAKEISNYIGRF